MAAKPPRNGLFLLHQMQIRESRKIATGASESCRSKVASAFRLRLGPKQKGHLDQRIELSPSVVRTAPRVRNTQPICVGILDQLFSPLVREDIQLDGSAGDVASWLEIDSLSGYGP